ncbi:glycosyltransferase family 2 protein [Candidatus Micrarchaeota archaeon]|nr:MAG: glycosyltransferase family 2 protein [Candidatus Micrarchaeota archaeon]
MITVVMPAFNEAEKGIENNLKELCRLKEVDEIVVVNDGSSDDTAKIVQSIARRNRKVKLVNHERNKGKGEAMRTGVKNARGDLIVFIDASQFSISDIPKVVKKAKNYDIVIGIRDFSKIPLLRRINNLLSRLAVFIATGRHISDSISGFRAIRKKDFIALDTKERGYAIEIEMNFKALSRGMTVGEVPVKVYYEKESSLPTLGSLKRSVYESCFTVLGVFRTWLGLW